MYVLLRSGTWCSDDDEMVSWDSARSVPSISFDVRVTLNWPIVLPLSNPAGWINQETLLESRSHSHSHFLSIAVSCFLWKVLLFNGTNRFLCLCLSLSVCLSFFLSFFLSLSYRLNRLLNLFHSNLCSFCTPLISWHIIGISYPVYNWR